MFNLCEILPSKVMSILFNRVIFIGYCKASPANLPKTSLSEHCHNLNISWIRNLMHFAELGEKGLIASARFWWTKKRWPRIRSTCASAIVHQVQVATISDRGDLKSSLSTGDNQTICAFCLILCSLQFACAVYITVQVLITSERGLQRHPPLSGCINTIVFNAQNNKFSENCFTRLMEQFWLI